jgi:autophagy-related protein 18
MDLAICALSPSSENNYMVYPLPAKKPTTPQNQPAHAPPTANYVPPSTGEVLVYDCNKLEAVNVIEAHQSALGCVSINHDGTMLATASEKGTIIRVFAIPNGEKLYQFRRGSLPAQIFCMSFNATSTLLCVSSATETVHIFRLINPGKNIDPSSPTSPPASSHSHSRRFSFSSRERSTSPSSEDVADTSQVDDSGLFNERPKPTNPTFASMIRRTSQNVGMSLAARVGGYLPSSVTEMWEPQRDFAWVKIPRNRRDSSSGPIRTVVAMSANHPQIMVVTSDGQFLVYNIDLEKGGEGVLEHQYS